MKAFFAIRPEVTKLPLPEQIKVIVNWIAERGKFDMNSSK